MIKLSSITGLLVVGEPIYGQVPAGPRLYPCTIDLTGNITLATGPDLVLGTRVAPAVPTAQGSFMAARVWNAVWNDYADFQKLNDQLVYGKVYYDTIEGAKICNQRCQMAVMGIATDTYGTAVGVGANYGAEVPLAVAGWALAYVDQEYPIGTPLTNDANGNLTMMTLDEKMKYPERLVATYKKRELDTQFGPAQKQVAVNGRHWVKVK